MLKFFGKLKEKAIMTQISCTRRIHFCAGHRVMGHENKCANAHGHNYYAYFEAEAEKLDSIGRVIDFSILKKKIGDWIDLNWDHTFLVFEQDLEAISALKMMPGNKPPFICPFNPTAENMALYLLEIICPQLLKETGVTVVKVTIQETDNCIAEAKIRE